jgi:post-segregation antitoxin (ccd killing protein)
MTVLPQLERDLVEAHARVTARRSRVWHAWPMRRAGKAGAGAVGSVGRARRLVLAGGRGLPTMLVVAVTLGVVAAFVVLVHARHAPSGTATAQLRREQGYITTARLQTERRDPACAAAAQPVVSIDGAPSRGLLSSLAALRAPGGGPIGAMTDDLQHVRPPVPTEVYSQYERLARTVALPATRSAPAVSISVYVVAAADVTGAASVPARCDAEQTAALRGELPQIPSALRTPTLQRAARTLAQRRSTAKNAEGIAVVAVSHDASGPLIAAYSATTTDFQQRGAISQAGFQSGASTILSGVVPDGVAAVTLDFPARLGGANPARTLSVTARPVENVFVLRLPRSFIPPEFGGTTPESIKWRAANGTVIRTIHPSS